jgi:hypothetical protein
MIEYRASAEGILAEQLAGFLEGWPNPPGPATHLALLCGSGAEGRVRPAICEGQNPGLQTLQGDLPAADAEDSLVFAGKVERPRSAEYAGGRGGVQRAQLPLEGVRLPGCAPLPVQSDRLGQQRGRLDAPPQVDQHADVALAGERGVVRELGLPRFLRRVLERRRARGCAVEAAALAVQEQSHHNRQILGTLQLELKSARYGAGLARRQYDAVDPDNRLVAGELERRWNEALERVQELESRLDREQHRAQPCTPADSRKSKLACRLGVLHLDGKFRILVACPRPFRFGTCPRTSIAPSACAPPTRA